MFGKTFRVALVDADKALIRLTPTKPAIALSLAANTLAVLGTLGVIGAIVQSLETPKRKTNTEDTTVKLVK